MPADRHLRACDVGEKTMNTRNRSSRGTSAIEFALIVPVWLSLTLGTVFVGSAMIREQAVTQMAVDLASMYSRGTDFSTGAGVAEAWATGMLNSITQQLGSVTAGGTGLVVFSTITYVGPNTCGAAHGVTGGLTTCANYQHWVFTQQYIQGNTSLRTPNSTLAPANHPYTADMNSDFNIPPLSYVENTLDQSTFNLITPVPNGTTDGYQEGQSVFVVEVYFKVIGSGGYGSYAVF